VFATQSTIALGGVVLVLLIAPDQNLLLALTRCLPPALLLSGVGAYVTLRSRLAIFGVVIVGLVWFIFGMFGDFFLPGQPMFYPLNYLQPFLWPLNAYLQPGRLPTGDYWLNRIFVLAAGICLIMLAVRQLYDEEHVLLAIRGVRFNAGKVD